MDSLLKKANKIFLDNFPSTVWFGRCIFLSWYCDLGTCKFCYRSTISHKIRHAKKAKRSLASTLADSIIGKNLGWPIEFLTGGYGIFEFDDIVDIAMHVSKVYGHKIWVNLGVMSDEELKKLQPYVEGVCASVETVNPVVHKDVCPDKDIAPYEDMLVRAKALGFKTSMTIVIGLGETKEDFPLLEDFIRRNSLDQITFYALKPIRGTPFTQSPEPEYYSWWIAKTRISFPKLKIMAGLTPKNVEYTRLLLEAGANSITKFPAIRSFNSPKAERIESLVRDSGREFLGSLTKIPDVDWESEIDSLGLSEDLKAEVRKKIDINLNQMAKDKSVA